MYFLCFFFVVFFLQSTPLTVVSAHGIDSYPFTPHGMESTPQLENDAQVFLEKLYFTRQIKRLAPLI